MRISDCSSDVCSSDLALDPVDEGDQRRQSGRRDTARGRDVRDHAELRINFGLAAVNREIAPHPRMRLGAAAVEIGDCANARRSEEHTSELQSLMRISYAVFCLKKKKITHNSKQN